MTAEISLPDPDEVKQAETLGKELSFLNTGKEGQIKLVLQKGSTEKELVFPPSAFKLLLRIIEQMALGNSVTLIPVHAQLTTQQAADLLNVSRPFIVKLLETGEIPFIKVGTHRRIKFENLMAYQKKMVEASEKAREKLSRLGQEMEQDD